MRLSVQSALAVQLLAYLAGRGAQPCSAATASEALSVSRHHLVKVAARLARAGLLDAARGAAGGFRLAAPTQGIKIGQVVTVTLPEASGFGPRSSGPVLARLGRLHEQAIAAYVADLDRWSLEDLIAGTAPTEHPVPVEEK